MRMIVWEDTSLARLGPLSETRPVFELRCGAVSLIERQRRWLEPDAMAVLVPPERAALHRFCRPNRPVNERLAGDGEQVVLVNGRWLAPLDLLADLDEPHAGLVGAQLAYLVLPASVELEVDSLARTVAAWRETLPNRPAGGAMIDYPWDLVQNNAWALGEDERWWRTHCEAAHVQGVTVQGPPERLLADPAARLEPLVLVDTTRGPVLIDRGAVVEAFSRLEGPCYVGPGAQVLGARVRASSLGPHCRVGGEVESSLLHGYCNKAHGGFLGHSYVGEWVNLGAGTQTCDLRNDYTTVRVRLGAEEIDTGLLKVGVALGDYTRVGSGTLLNCGVVIGACCHLLPGGLLRGEVPPFCAVLNGGLRERVVLGKLFTGLERAMARRGCRWTEEHAEMLLALFQDTEPRRQELLCQRSSRRTSA
jgi:UDP-N-acetylglucosamine diphosphorylase/glucosamine-1-phosphate N-acetyltransferase